MNLTKAVFWLTASEIIYNISGYIIHSGVGRILGPEDYGRYGLVITLTTMIIILIGNGIPTAMSKYLSEVFVAKPHLVGIIKKKAIFLQVLLMSGVTLLFFLAAPLFAYLLGDPTLEPLFRIATLIIPAFSAASFYFSFFTGIHKFHIQAILKTVRSLARLLLIVGLAYLFSVQGAVFGYIFAPLIVFFLAFAIDKWYLSGAIWKRVSLTEMFDAKKLWQFAWPITLFMLFYELLITIDIFLVKRLLADDYLTGIYNGALTVSRIPYYLFYALTIVLLPTISNATATGNWKKARSILNTTLRLELLLLTPIAALMIAFAPSVVSLFYGEAYFGSAEPLVVLTINASFLTVFYVASFALNGSGRVFIPLTLALGGLISNIILGLIFIPMLGLMGAAFSMTATSTVLMALSLFMLHEQFGAGIPVQSIIKVMIAGLCILLASAIFPQHALLFILWSLLLFGAYLLILHLLRELKNEDIEILKSPLKKACRAINFRISSENRKR